ncbi:myosin light chain kinase A-like isoform X2 [Zophobas morio]|uniref:myosin light chain kinase A-like isoform X2 n=1 Tax=Zophobas morio TaxID=2755281 RepID=UPI0030829262
MTDHLEPTLEADPLLTSLPVENNTNRAWGKLESLHPGVKDLTLVKEKYVFGRHLACDVNINGATVSSKHFTIAKMTLDKDGHAPLVILEDTSTNGTLLNGEKVVKETRFLADNTVIGLLFEKGEERIYQFRSLITAKHTPPSTLFPYEITPTILGTGSFAEVRLAVNLCTGLKVAAKCISKRKLFPLTDKAPVNDLNIEKAERCFRREADILRTIDHPCIIQFYDFFETKSAYYIFLELALDGSLFDHIINQGKLSERESLFFFYQMLTAVDHLHRLGITHRDLKPENILLEKTSSGDFLYKITDFGLAKIVGETSYMKTLCGTPGYVAPEVIFRGARSEQYTNVVDCWSLGVILYICLVGYPPFCEDPQIREEQVLTGHLYYNEEDWEGLSPKVFDLIQKLLRVDPKSRFTITQALNHEWMLDFEIVEKCKELLNNARKLKSC